MFLAPGPDVQAVLLYLALPPRRPAAVPGRAAARAPGAPLPRSYQPAAGARARNAGDPRGLDGRARRRCRATWPRWPTVTPSRRSIPTWRCCSPPRARPGARSWCGSRPGTSRPTPRAIADVPGLGPGERAMQSLPMHYSYGLSVLQLAPGGRRHGRADAALVHAARVLARRGRAAAPPRSPACPTCTRRSTGCGSTPPATRAPDLHPGRRRAAPRADRPFPRRASRRPAPGWWSCTARPRPPRASATCRPSVWARRSARSGVAIPGGAAPARARSRAARAPPPSWSTRATT